MEQIRITKELRYADSRRKRPAHLQRPRWFVWENVPGVFSSGQPKGEDFRIVLEEICRIADGAVHIPRPPGGVWESAGAILGEKFSVAWRVLDAQYWGVAQRRKRVFVVADFGGHTAPQILFEQDRLFGDSPQSKGAGKDLTAPTGNGAEAAGGYSGATGVEGIDRDITLGSTAMPGADCNIHECLTSWDVQSRRIFSDRGSWPALYSGQGGGHGYIATAFACNQRDEVRDLHDVAASVCASQTVKQQTFIADTNCLNPWDTQRGRIFHKDGKAPTLAGCDGSGGRNPGGLLFTAGFSAGASPTASTIGYHPEISPTLKSGGSGTNMVPSILCVNDQGGQRIDISEGVSGSLRASEKGHQPLVFESHGQGADYKGPLDVSTTVTASFGMGGGNIPLAVEPKQAEPLIFENHGIDSRYKGPLDVGPTVTARYGTGGNNIPLMMEPESYCIAGNIIDREPENGGNHFGYQPDISYTLNTADRHAVVTTKRPEPYQEVIGSLCRGDEKGVGSQYVGQDKCIVEAPNLIRRLTPLECERLQGFPDFWTLIPGCSDTARYKALGNSVAIPCVYFIMRGIAYFYFQQFAA